MHRAPPDPSRERRARTPWIIVPIAALLSAAACGDDSSSSDDDADGGIDVPVDTTGDAPIEADPEAAADADADADPDADAELDAEAEADVPVGPCDGACLRGERSACTCDPSDPCGWSGDGICDTRRCDRTVGTSFDDGTDCDTREYCGGDCSSATYTACTCDPRDPCRWRRDGGCDTADCEAAVPGGPIFDDSEDCAGAACDGSCRATVQNACTCDVADPCGWAGDGFCDEACATILPGGAFDDSADCGGTPGTLTVAATSVVNELNRDDMYLMATGLVGLGYEWVVRDADVTVAELATYLESDVTTLYHTSHGDTGVVVCADGTLDRGRATIAARNTIFATCLTLASPWNAAFGPTAETVLGYTDVSYDYIDDDVVRTMVTRLGAGARYILAWYQANVAVSGLDDRWAGYVREGTGIVEYSARTGVAPTADPLPSGEAWVPLAGGDRLFAAPALLDGARAFDAASRLLALGTDRGFTAGARRDAWEGLGATDATADAARAVALAFVEAEFGGLPADAVFDEAIPVFARREGAVAERIGWTVRWTREADGVPVRGNGVADHVAVLVGPAGAVAWSSWWPDRFEAPASAPSATLLLDAASALRAAAPELARALKGPLRLRAVRPVLGTRGPGDDLAVPAWEFGDGRGSTVVIDALAGRVLR
jgi:hypothetical protein